MTTDKIKISWEDLGKRDVEETGGVWLPAVVIMLVVVVLGFLGYWWLKPPDPIDILAIIDAIDSPSELPRVRKYCTEQGYELLQEFASRNASSNPSGEFECGRPKVSGEISDVPASYEVADIRMYVHFRFVKQNGWKFHDIYVNEINGDEIALWVSYMKEHPIETTIRLHWRTMLDAFLYGFAIGAGS